MKFERMKTILLVLLVISSIVLTINKWFNEKLWPEGYNFFSDVKNFFFSSDDDKKEYLFDPVEEILKPSEIIVNNSQNHILYTKSSEYYQNFFAEIKDIIELVSSDYTNDKCKIEEWNNALKGKSYYFSYPVKYNSDYFFSRDKKIYKGDIKAVKEFAVVNDIRIPSLVYVYIKDAETGDIFKQEISYESKMLEIISDNSAIQSDETNYFSFELKFDSEKQGTVTQPIIIDPDVLISITPKTLSSITEENLFDAISENKQIYNSILSEFGYNTSSIRKYVESDNSVVFVENYGTLKFHSDGVLEFKSIDNSKGIELGGDTAYECLNSCISFVDAITEHIPFAEGMNWQLSSDIPDVKSKTFTLVFDYYVNDNMLVTPFELYNMKNSIIVEVVSGKIVKYQQLCRSYSSINQFVTCPSVIDAIDAIEQQLYLPDNIISDIFTAYTYDSINGIWYPAWYVENSHGDIASIVL
ncbi:MAG: hypothetical protein E7394_07425 [Ruminococcaceae bacterium]|nr:hypothetical protein [Oscillospiraceae bacterium]